MEKSVSQVAKAPQQVYRAKEDQAQAFRPRYDPQAAKVRDSSADINSLLSSSATQTKQEHEVSVGIAKTMATDHISSMNEEINFLNSQLGPNESRNTVIKRLQTSIANTSGVSAGLSGDAAQAYDAMYIPTARKMSSNAISQWKGQQVEIDKSTMKKEFDSFMANTYANLDPESKQMHLSAWSSRMAISGAMTSDEVEYAGVQGQIDQFIGEAKDNPDADLVELANKSFGNYAQIDENGVIQMNTTNSKIHRGISEAIYNTIQPKLKASKISEIKDIARANQKNDDINNAYFAAYKTKVKAYEIQNGTKLEDGLITQEAYDKGLKEIEDEMQINVGTSATNEEIDNTLVSHEASKTAPYTTWARGKKRALDSNYAYGKYQMIKSTAQQAWDLAGIKGTMVHGAQTPAQQDKMYNALRENHKEYLTSIRMPITPDNVYAVHQLGQTGAKHLLTGRLSNEDIINMNNNLGKATKQSNPLDPNSRILVEQAWRLKFRKNSTSTAKSIQMKAAIDTYNTMSKYHKGREKEKDAAKGLALGLAQQKDLNSRVAQGKTTAEEAKVEQEKIDKFFDNENIVPRDREFAMDSIEYSAAKDIQDHERVQEKANLKMVLDAVEKKYVPGGKSYQALYKEEFDLRLGAKYQIKYDENRMQNTVATENQKSIAFAKTDAAWYKLNVSDTLTTLEGANASGPGFEEFADKWLDQATAMDKKRFENATVKYYGSSKEIVERSVNFRPVSEDVPVVGDDSGSGGTVTDKMAKQMQLGQNRKVHGIINRGFSKEKTDADKSALYSILNDPKGISQKTLMSVAKEEMEAMLGSPGTFASMYSSRPELYANTRFRAAMMASINDTKKEENFLMYELLTLDAMKQKKSEWDGADQKTIEARKPNETLSYTDVADNIASADQTIMLKRSSSSAIPGDEKIKLLEKGIVFTNYDAAMEKMMESAVPEEKKVIYQRSLNKLVRAGLDYMIPQLENTMGLTDNKKQVEGISVEGSVKASTYFTENPQYRERPAAFLAAVLNTAESDRGGNQVLSENQAQLLMDDGRVRVSQDLTISGQPLFLTLKYNDHTYSRIEIKEFDKNKNPYKYKLEEEPQTETYKNSSDVKVNNSGYGYSSEDSAETEEATYGYNMKDASMAAKSKKTKQNAEEYRLKKKKK